ncbi:MAG: cell division ATP-binding protein FtsE [Pseudomonadota bacterium]
MIELQHVTKRYSNGHKALDHVNFHLASGDFAFLTGHSGAGKSTLLKLIAGLEPVTEGRIRVANMQLNDLSQRRMPYLRRKIGIILQSPNLLMDRHVFDNVALPLIVSGGYNYKEISSRVRAVLAKVSLTNKENFYPYELSGGEQQRISIARAIVNKPELLVADEPTGNLDPDLAAEIMFLFEQFNQLGMTVLIASHDLGLIKNFKHQQFTLVGGKLLHAQGTADKISTFVE